MHAVISVPRMEASSVDLRAYSQLHPLPVREIFLASSQSRGKSNHDSGAAVLQGVADGITFTEIKGGACPGVPGTYTITVEATGLRFTLVHDDCSPRTADWPSGPWTKKK